MYALCNLRGEHIILLFTLDFDYRKGLTMKYKTWYYMFLAIMILPFILSVFIKDIEEQGENRTLAEKPDLIFADINEFPSEWEKYFNDHVPFRNLFVSINSHIKFYLFKDSPNDGIVIGNDNWLFIKKNEIESYKKINVYNEGTLEAAAEYFSVVSDYCKDNGAELIIFIAPDKAEIYPEKVPKYVIKLDKPKNKAEAFADYINSNTDVKVVYPKNDMIETKKIIKEDLYYSFDAHWNQVGAYVGTKALVKNMGVNLPDVQNLDIIEGERINYSLAGMMGIKNIASKEKDYVIDGYNLQRNETNIQYVDEHGNNVITYATNPLCDKNVLMLRDSFFTAMEPYISTCFRSIHAPHYTLFYLSNMIEEEKPDYVIVEVVERELDLFTYLDIIPPEKVGISPWDRFYPHVDSTIYEEISYQ